jgi:hypothetical protein
MLSEARELQYAAIESNTLTVALINECHDRIARTYALIERVNAKLI